MNYFKLYANRSDNWSTPLHIYNYFIDKGYIDFNPLEENYKNSLALPFNNYFCNPPFSNIEPFVDYMISCSKAGFKVIMLLPVRTCSLWFIKLLNYGCDFCFVGRLKYSGKGFAPFDSVIVQLIGNNINHFCYNKNYKSYSNFDGGFVKLNIFDFMECN